MPRDFTRDFTRTIAAIAAYDAFEDEQRRFQYLLNISMDKALESLRRSEELAEAVGVAFGLIPPISILISSTGTFIVKYMANENNTANPGVRGHRRR